jgi:hypothetical protein
MHPGHKEMHIPEQPVQHSVVASPTEKKLCYDIETSDNYDIDMANSLNSRYWDGEGINYGISIIFVVIFSDLTDNMKTNILKMEMTPLEPSRLTCAGLCCGDSESDGEAGDTFDNMKANMFIEEITPDQRVSSFAGNKSSATVWTTTCSIIPRSMRRSAVPLLRWHSEDTCTSSSSERQQCWTTRTSEPCWYKLKVKIVTHFSDFSIG